MEEVKAIKSLYLPVVGVSLSQHGINSNFTYKGSHYKQSEC